METEKMSKFEKSRWADNQFSQDYRDEANMYLPLRSLFIEITKLFYGYFLSQKSENRVLDLGCGDGLFIQELLESYSPAEVVLVDGSQEMLDAAKDRLGNHSDVQFIKASFQELLAEDLLAEDFSFVFSSLAIHHLTLQEKIDLYRFIHDHLLPAGCFVHYDVVLPPTEELEEWYLSLWTQWIEQHTDKTNRKKLHGIPRQYRGNPDNTPDMLKSQMEALEKIGFKSVDCYCKYGIFSLFGGVK
jgi:tRNA (cmo5U34)-methyltransferase